MAKIENTVVYPYVTPQPNDYVILTDVSDNNATKTCKIKDITSFSGITVVSRTLNAAQLKASKTNPIILVQPLGTNRICFPMGYDVLFKTVNGTVPFDFGTIASGEGARITTSPNPMVVQPVYTLEQGRANGDSIANNTTIYSSADFNVKDWLPYRNSPILFYSDTPPVLGNGTLTINFQYRIITI